MTIRSCLWCSQRIGMGNNGDEAALCGSCYDHFSLLPGGPTQKHLDRLSFPILGVQLYAGKRMISRVVNKTACAWLNKEPNEIIQHLAGNVLDCATARLPEGCGAALLCEECGVLRSVVGTSGGEPIVEAPIKLYQEYGHSVATMLRLTTIKSNGLVMLKLEKA